MSRAHLTALAAALALGAFAPRLMAQDTSSAGVTPQDTSGYTGAGGVDTSGPPSRFGTTDTAGAAADTSSLQKPGDSIPNPAAAADTMAPMGDDTSGMSGRHGADSTKAGEDMRPGRADADSLADSGAVDKQSP